MSLITTDNLSHAYGQKPILRGASLSVAEGDRIAIVGPNGEGKTTLLKILGGLLDPTQGRIDRRRDLRVGYLPQDPPALSGSTVHDAMLDVFADLRHLEQELHAMAERMSTGGDGDPAALDRYGLLQTRFETQGGYDYPKRIERVLTGLGFSEALWHRPLDKLSGGQRTRAYLATLLLQSPDLLMLDEPTNHLDIDSVEWLEGYLSSFDGALLVVSHDRYFLDRITNKTWQIAFAEVETYKGNYTAYLKQREQRFKERIRQWEAQQQYIAETQDFIRRNLAGQRTKEAQGRRTRLERFLEEEAIEKPREHRTIHLALSAGKRTGDVVIGLEALEIGYSPDATLVRVEELALRRGQRVAIVGPNGSGKTTLLRTVLGELEPLSGKIILGQHVRLGYLSQTHAALDPNHTALEAVRDFAGCTELRARSVLGSLLLSGQDALRPIHELSGGQRSRVVLAQLAVIEANVLVLDEPTNHLDIPSTEIIQDALRRFDGTVLFVSHDRYLIEAAATSIWAIDGGGVKCIAGGWEDYLLWRETGRQQAQQAAAVSAGDEGKKNRKEDYKEARRKANLLQRLQRRFEQLEQEIHQAEEDLERLEADISAAGESGDVGRVEDLGGRYQKRSGELESLMAEWEEVAEQLE